MISDSLDIDIVHHCNMKSLLAKEWKPIDYENLKKSDFIESNERNLHCTKTIKKHLAQSGLSLAVNYSFLGNEQREKYSCPYPYLNQPVHLSS